MFDFLKTTKDSYVIPKPSKDSYVIPPPTANTDVATKEDAATLLDRLLQLDYQLRELQRTLVRVETKLCITADALGVGDKLTRKRSY